MNSKELINSYDLRFNEVCCKKFLTTKDISSSQKFFEEDSLIKKNPMPKKLDVYCLVSGLPFDGKFINHIKKIQLNLKSILSSSNYYLVEPENLAVEYIVLKWPENKLEEKIIAQTINELKNIKEKRFKLKSYGFQFHSDGAIIMRCIDQDQMLQKIRSKFISAINNLPQKQSNWCHVPIGRILDSIDNDTFRQLLEFSKQTQSNMREETLIEDIKLIHEHRWYQTNRSTLAKVNLI